MARPDYDRATWHGAHSSNYTAADRGAEEIERVVVHVTQGSWAGALNWFQDSAANVSAHYTIRSSDGRIGQSVEEKDIAWHAGNWTYNETSIGIEHEGYVSDSSWFTDEMYRSSARLTGYLCNEYGIPADREHIIGHNEVPGADHTDPGQHWDWPRYMRLVRYFSAYRQVVDNASSRFRASKDWSVSTYSDQKFREDYHYITPQSGPGSAKFLMRFPERGRYAIYARWPANSGYNSRARFLIKTTDGWKRKIVDQRRDGGQWVHLGNYDMREGDGSYVRLAKRSAGSGYIIADAVMIRKL